MKLTPDQISKSIKEKLDAKDRKVCIYHNLNTYECQFYDYYNMWNNEDINISDLRKDFNDRIFPLAKKNGDLKMSDTVHLDQAGFQTYTVYDRSISSCYTPYGIKRIDAYFSNRICHVSSLDDSYTIEKEIMLCPHIHIFMKKNLLHNLKLRIRSDKIK